MAEYLMVNAVNHKANSGDPENYRLIRLLNINKVHGKLAKKWAIKTAIYIKDFFPKTIISIVCAYDTCRDDIST